MKIFERKKKHLTLILTGGLGNQLFQIFFIKELSAQMRIRVSINDSKIANHLPFAAKGLNDLKISPALEILKYNNSLTFFEKVRLSLSRRFFNNNYLALRVLGVVNDYMARKEIGRAHV